MLPLFKVYLRRNDALSRDFAGLVMEWCGAQVHSNVLTLTYDVDPWAGVYTLPAVQNVTTRQVAGADAALDALKVWLLPYMVRDADAVLEGSGSNLRHSSSVSSGSSNTSMPLHVPMPDATIGYNGSSGNGTAEAPKMLRSAMAPPPGTEPPPRSPRKILASMRNKTEVDGVETPEVRKERLKAEREAIEARIKAQGGGGGMPPVPEKTTDI